MLKRERILVTVRTYPTPSTGNRETVCTGGVTDEGEWRRLYPVQLRHLPKRQQFRTWDVINVPVKAARDNRPESRRPELSTLAIENRIGDWSARYEWLKGTIHSGLDALIAGGKTLGPTWIEQVKDLDVKPASADWTPRQRAKLEQKTFFEKTIPLEKVPYEFRFVWCDVDGNEHKSLVIAWEMAETWRKYRKKYDDPIAKMKEKLLEDYFGPERRSAFFMGNHSRRRHIFMVCGWFIPPRREIQDEFLWQRFRCTPKPKRAGSVCVRGSHAGFNNGFAAAHRPARKWNDGIYDRVRAA